MPFTAKQLQLWSPLSKRLTVILMRRCSESLIGGILPSSMRRDLHALVKKAMRDNSEADSIFIEAFVAYSDLLEAQALNSTQYNQAIIRFYEIPVVNTMLEQLKALVILQASHLALLKASLSSSASLNPLGKESDSHPSEFLIDSGSLEESSASWQFGQDEGDSAPSLSSASEDDPFSALEVSSDSKLSIEKLMVGLSDEDSASARAVSPSSKVSMENLKLTFSMEEVHAGIGLWVDERYSPVDERVLSSGVKRQRRMDSLSRLLSLRSSLSVCSAVTLNLINEPHIVIGANVGKDGSQDEIAGLTADKLALIQRHLREISASDIASIDSSKLDWLAENLFRDLFTTGGSSMPPDVLLQAARKIIHAFCIDGETFSADEKIMFLTHSSTVILLPILTDKGYRMLAKQIRAIGCTNSSYPLPMVPMDTSVHNIHAEQLIARYLYEEREIDTPLTFGISKLCCRTCFESLKNYPVTSRGTHNQEYEGVIDLHSGRRRAESSARRATTHSWPSPKDTPDRDLLKRPADEEAALPERKFRSKCVERVILFEGLTDETASVSSFAALRMSAPAIAFFKSPPRHPKYDLLKGSQEPLSPAVPSFGGSADKDFS